MVERGRRSDAEELRAAAKLLMEATLNVTRVVEAMHRAVGSGPAVLGRPLATPVRHAIAPAYALVRGVTRVAGAGVDLILAQLAPLLSRTPPGPQRQALIAALNGVLGDYLHDSGSPLAQEMVLCRDGEVLRLERAALPRLGSRLLVLVHGSCLNDGQWLRAGHDHGAALEERRGLVALRLRYNSGRHISTNGRELSTLLERLVAEWPAPVEELVLLGHSMGGLVARSACHTAERERHTWRSRLTHLVTLGSPHHGASLERAGNWLEFLLGISAYSAPLAALGRVRSAGVSDLRYGTVLDEDWAGVDRFSRRPDNRRPLPLPVGVRCFAVAGTKSLRPARRLRSDGLVTVPSALGEHGRPELRLAFPPEHRFIAYGADHLGLLAAEDVLSALCRWL